MRNLLFLVSLCLSLSTSAQTIKGKVIDAETNEPIAFANVFFVGTLIGSTTDLDGNFSFDVEKPGRFDLAVTYVGYKEYISPVDTDNLIPFLQISLQQEVIQLQGVSVNADTTGWANNFQTFRPLFLGRTRNARKVEIVNPRDIYLFYDQVERGLFAHARKEIVIENEALGYRINYIMKTFSMDYKAGAFSSYGIPRFEEMEPKSNGQMKRWSKNRRKAYEGSFPHFLNSLKDNSFIEAGFLVSELFKVPNRDRPPQKLINQQMAKYRAYNAESGNTTIVISANTISDSLSYWDRMNRMPKVIDSLGRSFKTNELLIDENNNLTYTGYLQVIYTKEHEDPSYAWSRPGGQIDNKQTTTVLFKGPLKIFDNGYYDVTKVFYLGYLGWSSRMAEMLPQGYIPEE